MFHKGLVPFFSFYTPFGAYYWWLVNGGWRHMHELADRFLL